MRPLAVRSAAPTGKFENGQYARFWASRADWISSLVWLSSIRIPRPAVAALCDSFNDQRRRVDAIVADGNGCEQIAPNSVRCIRFCVQTDQGLTGFNMIAEADEHLEADGQIELVTELLTSATELDDHAADLFGIDYGYV